MWIPNANAISSLCGPHHICFLWKATIFLKADQGHFWRLSFLIKQ